MKDNLANMNKLIFILLLGFVSCKKDDQQSPPPPPQQPSKTITQDSRLLGGWRLDSMQWGNTMEYSTGQGQLTDSINLNGYSYNGNTPVIDLNSFFINSGIVTTLPSYYFWDTSSQDSLFIKAGNHFIDPASSYKFSINGNKLILIWSTWSIEKYLTPPNPKVAISYYHK